MVFFIVSYLHCYYTTLAVVEWKNYSVWFGRVQ